MYLIAIETNFIFISQLFKQSINTNALQIKKGEHMGVKYDFYVL